MTYRLRILEEWNSFRQQVLFDAPPEVLVPMRSSFYSGVIASLNIIQACKEPAKSAEVLKDLIIEVNRFREEINKNGQTNA